MSGSDIKSKCCSFNRCSCFLLMFIALLMIKSLKYWKACCVLLLVDGNIVMKSILNKIQTFYGSLLIILTFFQLSVKFYVFNMWKWQQWFSAWVHHSYGAVNSCSCTCGPVDTATHGHGSELSLWLFSPLRHSCLNIQYKDVQVKNEKFIPCELHSGSGGIWTHTSVETGT